MRKTSKPLRQLKPLDNLFGAEDQAPVSIPLSEIKLPGSQPRRYFDQKALDELIVSVKQHGVLQPVLVRPLEDGGYSLVAGERRYRASLAAGLSDIPVVIKELTDEEAMVISLTENLLREDLNPIEEAEGIIALLAHKLSINYESVVPLLRRMKKAHDTYGASSHEEVPAVEEVFEGLGMTWVSFIKNRVPVLNLPKDILDVVREGKLEYTKARLVGSVKDSEMRAMVLEKALKDNLSYSQIQTWIRNLDLSGGKGQPPSYIVQETMKKINRSKAWEDAGKWEKIQGYLEEINKLLGG